MSSSPAEFLQTMWMPCIRNFISCPHSWRFHQHWHIKKRKWLMIRSQEKDLKSSTWCKKPSICLYKTTIIVLGIYREYATPMNNAISNNILDFHRYVPYKYIFLYNVTWYLCNCYSLFKCYFYIHSFSFSFFWNQ